MGSRDKCAVTWLEKGNIDECFGRRQPNVVGVTCLHDHRTSFIPCIVIVVRRDRCGGRLILVITMTVVISALVVEQPTEMDVGSMIVSRTLFYGRRVEMRKVHTVRREKS